MAPQEPLAPMALPVFQATVEHLASPVPQDLLAMLDSQVKELIASFPV